MQSTILLRLTRIKVEAAGIKSFQFQGFNGQELPAFAAGAHIDVHLGDGLVRQYSLCNSPAERHRYLIAVLVTPDSRGGSVGMHGLREGQVLSIGGPRNHFPLAVQEGRAEPHFSLLLAGGVGITPILCMAESLADAGHGFHLHYAARSRNHMAFRSLLQEGRLAARSRLYFDDGDSGQRLDMGRVLAAQNSTTHLYVCGPTGFIQAAVGRAKEFGWADQQVHFEYFAAAPKAREDDTDFCVRIHSTGQELAVGPEESVLSVLVRHGIQVPTSCEQGVCGTCATGVLEGECDHRDLYLDRSEQASHQVFLPCVSRARSPLLVLDL